MKYKILSEFTIPALPPSINKSYKVNYRTKQVYCDWSVRQFRNKAILSIPHIDVKKYSKLEVNIKYYGKFMNKNGTIRRKDGQNLDKCLYDVIFHKLGVDDSVVFKGSWEKIDCSENKTSVKIKGIV